MAKSGSGVVKAPWHTMYGIYFSWIAEQSVSENYSDITLDAYADFTSYGTISVGARNDGKMSIAGKEQTVYMPSIYKMSVGDARYKLATIKQRVYHNTDGTLPNVSLRVVWPIRATISGVYRSTITCDFSTGEIDRIPRASEIISSVDFTLENLLKVNLKSYYDEFRHDITLKINNNNFKTLTNQTSMAIFTFTQTEINNLYNVSKNTGFLNTELTVNTKQNSTVIGTNKKDGKMYIDPIKNSPLFDDFQFKPDSKTTNATGWSGYVNEDNGKTVLGKTIYTIKPALATGVNGATISKYEVILNNKTYSFNSNEFTLPNPILYNDDLVVYAIDSRGFKTKVIKHITGEPYAKLLFTQLDINRRIYPNQTSINFKINGKMYKTNVVNNVLTARFRSKVVGGSWGSWVNLTSNFTVQTDGTFTSNFNRNTFDSTKNYELEFEMSDYFYTETFKISINMELPVFSIGDTIYINGTPLVEWEEI